MTPEKEASYKKALKDALMAGEETLAKGGASLDAVETAVLNKRGGGIGLITGRKSFQKPMKQGIELLHAIQDVYLCKEVTVA